MAKATLQEKSASVTLGRRSFVAFLVEHNIGLSAAAVALGVSVHTVHCWRAGTKRPKPHHRDAISVWTNGKVSAGSWDEEGERAQVSAIRPFKVA